MSCVHESICYCCTGIYLHLYCLQIKEKFGFQGSPLNQTVELVVLSHLKTKRRLRFFSCRVKLLANPPR